MRQRRRRQGHRGALDQRPRLGAHDPALGANGARERPLAKPGVGRVAPLRGFPAHQHHATSLAQSHDRAASKGKAPRTPLSTIWEAIAATTSPITWVEMCMDVAPSTLPNSGAYQNTKPIITLRATQARE